MEQAIRLHKAGWTKKTVHCAEIKDNGRYPYHDTFEIKAYGYVIGEVVCEERPENTLQLPTLGEIESSRSITEKFLDLLIWPTIQSAKEKLGRLPSEIEMELEIRVRNWIKNANKKEVGNGQE